MSIVVFQLWFKGFMNKTEKWPLKDRFQQYYLHTNYWRQALPHINNWWRSFNNYSVIRLLIQLISIMFWSIQYIDIKLFQLVYDWLQQINPILNQTSWFIMTKQTFCMQWSDIQKKWEYTSYTTTTWYTRLFHATRSCTKA